MYGNRDGGDDNCDNDDDVDDNNNIIDGYKVKQHLYQRIIFLDTFLTWLFFCVLVEDLERNDGSEQKPYYMSKSLKKILGKKNKKASDDDD